MLRVGLAAATAAAVNRIQLASPADQTAYSREASGLLVRCCDLAGEQYRRSRAEPTYDGSIRLLDAYQDAATLLRPYRQIQSFQLPELSLSGDSALAAKLAAHTPAAHTPAAKPPAVRQRVALSFDNVIWGYALTSDQGSIIALRGTQTESEMAIGATAFQVGFGAGGAIHAGFYLIYQGLIDQIRAAATQFDPALPCYVTGYSIGGAVAVLAASTLARETRLKDQIQVYTYAGPRIGDPSFARSYNSLVPCTYRVVNRADIVPNLPLENFRGAVYQHVGQEIAYSFQCGNVDRNHAISTYRKAVDQGLEALKGTAGQTQDQITCT